ncbi:hypothetical protein [Campylobacter sp. CS_ED2]|uniref:hypothetical protein n=1 Tax=Campylobacter sp. CS_ED2 TaxID=2984141 RepID=UPI0022E9F5F5|nr:hypothetical protein [Campylobacter sp. CS_ED2]
MIKTEFINSTIGDCFVASLLAMTMDRQLLRFALQKLAMTMEAIFFLLRHSEPIGE